MRNAKSAMKVCCAIVFLEEVISQGQEMEILLSFILLGISGKENHIRA